MSASQTVLLVGGWGRWRSTSGRARLQLIAVVWQEPLSDTELRREMAAIFTEHGAPFGDKGIAAAVSTMKLIPVMGQPTKKLIGANGVYDMATRRFRPHSPADGLLNHNGIEYAAPRPGESIEQHAPSFSKWLSHAEDDATKMARIKAASIWCWPTAMTGSYSSG